MRVMNAGGLVRKIAYHGRRACPDRLVGFGNGRHALVELKRPLGTARAEQEREHERLRAVGFEVVVLSSIAEIDEFIARMVK